MPSKSSAKDQAQSKFHKVEGNFSGDAREAQHKPGLEAEGRNEECSARFKTKTGQVNNVPGKQEYGVSIAGSPSGCGRGRALIP